MDAVALADKDFEGGFKEALSMYDISFFLKLWVQEVEIESLCLIGMYECCGFGFAK